MILMTIVTMMMMPTRVEWSVIGFASDFSEGVFWSTTHSHELFDGNKSDLDEFWNDWNVHMV